jgi:hypothetical protein
MTPYKDERRAREKNGDKPEMQFVQRHLVGEVLMRSREQARLRSPIGIGIPQMINNVQVVADGELGKAFGIAAAASGPARWCGRLEATNYSVA